MSLLSSLLGRLKSDPSMEYTHVELPGPVAPSIQPDKQYLRVWLRSARITEVRRWTTKFHASVHARFALVDRSQPRREVVCIVAPDKTFSELDPKHTDRLITVNKALLGPVPWRGELECDIGLFSIAATDLAEPYLSLLADLTDKAGVASLTQAFPWAETIRRGAEILFSEAQRSNLETGLSRTDTTLASGHWLVARVPKGQLPVGLQLDPNDFGLLDANGQPVTGFPYMVIGLEVLDKRDDYATLPDVKPAWDAVTKAVAEGTEDDVRQRFAQLRRTVALSPDLVPVDRRRVIELFREELVGAGFEIESIVTPARALEAESTLAARSRSSNGPLTLRRAEDLLTPRAMAAAGVEALPTRRTRKRAGDALVPTGIWATATAKDSRLSGALGPPRSEIVTEAPDETLPTKCDAADELDMAGESHAHAPERGSLAQPADPAKRQSAVRSRPAGLEAPIPWRLAASLKALRSTLDALAPSRSKLSDGSIGNAAHASRASDHNPWVVHGSQGVVTAIDVTHDPKGGCDVGKLAESLRIGRDPRIKYVIFDRRIFSATIQPWQWRPYAGKNPHSHHVHVSVAPSAEQYDDVAVWQVGV